MDHPDAQMAKLHEIMPRYAMAQTAINAALEKGDTATIAKETSYILGTTADLQKSRPHKKLDQIGKFKAIAKRFEMDVRATAEHSQKGDVKAAKKSFSEAQHQCAACHEKFRD